jgi:hypothetical protein
MFLGDEEVQQGRPRHGWWKKKKLVTNDRSFENTEFLRSFIVNLYGIQHSNTFVP